MSVLYPVAENAEAALDAPVGRAVREREARAFAGQSPGSEVVFTVEEVGPAFETREAALEGLAGRLDEAGGAVAPEDRFLTLREVMAPVKGGFPSARQVEPEFKGGRRWPKPRAAPKTQWRLSISYWRIVSAKEAARVLAPARKARKDPASEALDRDALAELARQPLKPVAPQQPLDIGLFEARAPEDPGLVLPDE
jgi:hypothetical protein